MLPINILPVLGIAIVLTEVIWGVDYLARDQGKGNPPAGGQKEAIYDKVLGTETSTLTTETMENPNLPAFPPVLSESANPEEITSLTPSPATEKRRLRLLLLGDSMIDFLNDFPHLRDMLRSLNPNTEWEILNHGVGASNVSYGLYRVNSEYDYLGRHFRSVVGTNPDIIVVESFAYNHGDMPESQYQDSLKRIFSALKEADKKIIFLATIAPSKANYARGAADWGDEYRSKEYEKTRRFIDLGIDTARQMGVPTVDAFHQSLDGEKGGNEKYIYGGDWIHPSPEGAEFIARLLAPAIVSLIEWNQF